MFTESRTTEGQDQDQKSPSSKKAHRKSKPRDFANLTDLMQDWHPNDPMEPRRYLVNELMVFLEEKGHSCVRSCIPALIVDKQFPIDLLHYHSENDLNELMSRILWMRQEFNSAIGILLGILDEETAAMVEEAFEGILLAEEDCIVLLM